MRVQNSDGRQTKKASPRLGPSILKRLTEILIFSSTSSYVEPPVPLVHTPMPSKSRICWSCDPDFITKNTRAEDPFEPQTVQRRADIFAFNAIAPFLAMRAFQLLLVKGVPPPRHINVSSMAVNVNNEPRGICCIRADEGQAQVCSGNAFCWEDSSERTGAWSEQLSPDNLEKLISGLVTPIRQGAMRNWR
ncbi:hypothetical protein EV421DRAFT_358000 [Armillaria borealis]|uniref:NAD(P)-binding protein n=1 Tax=Armillaria borealis TaxID=47425 RepID=A0AA39IUX8_9AGAR|nr:hypothetical protein EV421DRAFT_358000 [Armillaria borealis]